MVFLYRKKDVYVCVMIRLSQPNITITKSALVQVQLVSTLPQLYLQLLYTLVFPLEFLHQRTNLFLLFFLVPIVLLSDCFEHFLHVLDHGCLLVDLASLLPQLLVLCFEVTQRLVLVCVQEV